MRNHRGQTVPNYPRLCQSFTHHGPESFPSLNKIVVFDDPCAVKETGHYRELLKSLKIILGQNASSSICFYFLWCPLFIIYVPPCYFADTVFHNSFTYVEKRSGSAFHIIYTTFHTHKAHSYPSLQRFCAAVDTLP